jgi:hypothetical protein
MTRCETKRDITTEKSMLTAEAGPTAALWGCGVGDIDSCAIAPTAMRRTAIIATREKLDLAISELVRVCMFVCVREREKSWRGLVVAAHNGERGGELDADKTGRIFET